MCGGLKRTWEVEGGAGRRMGAQSAVETSLWAWRVAGLNPCCAAQQTVLVNGCNV